MPIGKPVTIVVAVSLLTACYVQSPLAATQPASNVATKKLERVPPAKSAQTLYVLNTGGSDTSVTVYDDLGKSLLQNIDLGKSSSTSDLTVDGAGDLFASNGGTLSVYADRGAKLLRKKTASQPFALLTTDSLGNLYTQCGASTVCEYTAGSTKILRRLPYPSTALATGRSNDLAIDQSFGAVYVFGPKGKRPVRTIPGGAYNSPSLAFDQAGNLYVANDASADFIAVYAPGATRPTRTISNGLVAPRAIALDRQGYLYVLNGNDVVEVYAPGGDMPITTIQDLDRPVALALDTSGKLYVANNGDGFADLGSIAIFKRGAAKYETAITDGIANPTALAVLKS